MGKVFIADRDGAKWEESVAGGYLWLNRRDGLAVNVHLNSGGADVYFHDKKLNGTGTSELFFVEGDEGPVALTAAEKSELFARRQERREFGPIESVRTALRDLVVEVVDRKYPEGSLGSVPI